MADPYVGAARAAIGQGLGMGWGDEAEAWLRERLGQGSYEDQLKSIRGEYADFSKEHPVMSGALEFAGGAAPGVAAMMVPGGQAAGAAQLQRSGAGALARLAGVGAATGAVSGAGSAEEGRLSGGLGGAAIGGALGTAIPMAMKGTSAAGKWLAEKLYPTEQRVARSAAEKMTKALSEGNLTPQQIERKIAQDRAMNVPSVVANVSPATVDLAEAVAQRTGKGARNVAETLTGQKAGARERTYTQVSKNMQPGDYYSDEQKLVADLRSKAGSLYENAYAHGSVDDARINAVLKDPEFAGFFNKAKEIANKEAMAAKLRGEDPSKYQLEDIYKLVFDPQTQVLTPVVTRLPDVRTLDYMKRGIDATIDSLYTSGRSAEGTALKQLRKEFVNALDENVPAYQQARKGYAGDMEVIDAMRMGMNDFGKLDHEQVTRMVAGMSTGEKEAFRTGVARDIYGKVMNPSGNFNAAQRLIGSPEMQAKLQPLFDNPQQFNLFKTALERESQLFNQANQVLGGSQTGKRLQMRENLDAQPGVGDVVRDAVTGGFWNSLTGIATRAIRNTEMPEKTAEKLSQMLMAKDPHEVAAVVKLLEDHAAQAAPKAYRMGAAETGAVTGSAASFWPSPTRQDAAQDIESQPRVPIEGPDIEAAISQQR